MLPGPTNQLEGEISVEHPAIDQSRRDNIRERRQRRRAPPVRQRIGDALSDTLMDVVSDDDSEKQEYEISLEDDNEWEMIDQQNENQNAVN